GDCARLGRARRRNSRRRRGPGPNFGVSRRCRPAAPFPDRRAGGRLGFLTVAPRDRIWRRIVQPNRELAPVQPAAVQLAPPPSDPEAQRRRQALRAMLRGRWHWAIVLALVWGIAGGI